MEAAIRKACQKAHGMTKATVRIEMYEDCGLADVLAALGKDYSCSGSGQLMVYEPLDEAFVIVQRVGVPMPRWHLPATLSGQPDATVSAIYGITSGKGNE